MKKIILLAGFICVLTNLANAIAPQFSEDSGIRISSATGSFILPLGGDSYRIFFSTGFGIVSATSSDCGLTWGIEQDFRIKSSTFVNYDDHDVLNPTILRPSNTYYRMIYEGVTLNPTTSHFFLSAISTDTVNWYKEINIDGKSIIRFKILSGATTVYISAPDVIETASDEWRMYYTVSATNLSISSTDDAIGSAVSSDGGATWTKETGFRIEQRVTNPDCVKLTNGYYRLYWTENNSILSSLSSDGLAFVKEAYTRISVEDEKVVTDPEIIRLSDGYRWRLFYSVGISSVGPFELYSALADCPLITGVTPNMGRNNQIIGVKITGEIFDSTSTVKLIRNSNEIVATTVNHASDMELNVTFDLTNKSVGIWNLQVTNSNGKYGTYNNCFEIRYPPGEAEVIDNLIRIWENKPAKINFKTYGGGLVKVKIYTLDGRLVKTLVNETLAADSYSKEWKGLDDAGDSVASGVYVVYFEGTELKTRKKIVLVR